MSKLAIWRDFWIFFPEIINNIGGKNAENEYTSKCYAFT